MSNEILRVGFSTNDEVMLEGHFGHCEKFAIYTIENGKAVKKRNRSSTRACTRSIS